MSISFGSNISSLRAQRQLGKETAELNTVFERLSSGLRINSAADDAAGLAVSSGLDADRRIFSQGVRNLNDGISLLNVADGAVEQLVDIVTRLKELSQQAANGTYGLSQRTALDTEAQALSREYSRIVQSTSFNGQNLFSAAFGQLKVQSGFGVNGGIQSALGGSIGTGGFGSVSFFATETGAVSGSNDVALGDLNGDGILDYVSTGGQSSAQGYATVKLGTGGGSFGSPISYTTQSLSSYSVVLGDLNGDGILDLVTAGYGATGEVSVRLGVGDGTFGSRSSYVAESSFTFDVALADFNRDGNLDLVSTGTGGGPGFATVRLGAGNGTFGSAASYQMGTTGSYNVTAGDLNNDGILDLVTASSSGSSEVVSRLGNGDGTFKASTAVSATVLGNGLSLGDLNGDGNLDAFTNGASGPGAGTAEVFFGTGTGSFTSVLSYSGGAGRTASIADVNGDGRLDLVDSSRTTLNVRLNIGNGSFAPAYTYTITNSSVLGLALGDLDADGVLDIVTGGTDLSALGQGSVRLQQATNGIGPLLNFSLKTRADALQASPKFDQALNRLTVQRGVIGAFQSRIETAVNTLSIATEGYRTAVSQITDADVAVEAASLVRTKILQQAAGAVLAQANQQPGLALSLLKGPDNK